MQRATEFTFSGESFENYVRRSHCWFHDKASLQINRERAFGTALVHLQRMQGQGASPPRSLRKVALLLWSCWRNPRRQIGFALGFFGLVFCCLVSSSFPPQLNGDIPQYTNEI